MAKSPLALLQALTGGAKSAEAPPEEMSETETEIPMAEEATEKVSESPSSLMLPKGFKAATDKDGIVTTTIRGKINGDHLDVIAIGDMPMDGRPTVEEAAPAPEEEVVNETTTEEPDPEEAKMAMSAKRKRDESMKAKKAFQS